MNTRDGFAVAWINVLHSGPTVTGKKGRVCLSRDLRVCEWPREDYEDARPISPIFGALEPAQRFLLERLGAVATCVHPFDSDDPVEAAAHLNDHHPTGCRCDRCRVVWGEEEVAA